MFRRSSSKRDPPSESSHRRKQDGSSRRQQSTDEPTRGGRDSDEPGSTLHERDSKLSSIAPSASHTSSHRSTRDPGTSDKSRSATSEKKRHSRHTDDDPRRREQSPPSRMEKASSSRTKTSSRNPAKRSERSIEGAPSAISGRADSYTQADLSSHIPNQFPDQTPLKYAAPYLPGQSNDVSAAVGAAAEYYGDQGESISFQPGVRPGTPIVVGMEPHLMPALSEPAPPVETGSGAAAEFYGAPNASIDPASNMQSTISSGQAQATAPHSSRPSKSTSRPHSGSLATAAVGAAAFSAAAYHSSQQQSRPQQHVSTGNISSISAHPTSSHWSAHHSHSPHVHTQRPSGPLDQFVDWWKDYDDIRKMEAYTEYIGVCRHCFDPRSSAMDAPRPHKPRKVRSRESMNHIRVSKGSRYRGSDAQGKRHRNSSWFAAGLAGVGLGQVASFFDDDGGSSDSRSEDARRFDSSNVRTDARRRPTQDRRGHYTTPQHADSTPEAKTSTGRPLSSGTTYMHHSPERQDRRRDSGEPQKHRSPKQDSPFNANLDRVPTNTIDSSARHSLGHSSRRVAVPQASPQVQVDRRRRRKSASSSSSDQKAGFLGRLFSNPKKSTPRRRERKRRSSSSSSAHTDANATFAHRSGARQPTTRPDTKQKVRRSSSNDARNALLGLGAAAAALAAHDARRSRPNQLQSDVVAVRQPKPPKYPRPESLRRTAKGDDSDDGAWESEYEDSDTWSADSDLAFGEGVVLGSQHSARSSTLSLSSQSSGTGKWGWRWGGKRSNRPKSPEGETRRNVRPSVTHESRSPASAELYRQEHDRFQQGNASVVKQGPLKNVDPIPADEMEESIPYDDQRPVLASPPKKLSIESPRPIIPAKPFQGVVLSDDQISPKSLPDERQGMSSPDFDRRSPSPPPRTRPYASTVSDNSAQPTERDDRPRSEEIEEVSKRPERKPSAGWKKPGMSFAGVAAGLVTAAGSNELAKSQKSQSSSGKQVTADQRRQAKESASSDEERFLPAYETTDVPSDPRPASRPWTETERAPTDEGQFNDETRKELDAHRESDTQKEMYAGSSSSIDEGRVQIRREQDHHGEPIYDDEIFDPNLFKRRRKESSPDDTPTGVKAVFDDLHDRYAKEPQSSADFFSPPELRNARPNVLDRRYDFSKDDTDQLNEGRITEKSRSIPRLEIIAPTPPHSVAGSTRTRSSSPSRSPLRNVTTSGDSEPELEQEPVAVRKVRWAVDNSKPSQPDIVELDEEDQTAQREAGCASSSTSDANASRSNGDSHDLAEVSQMQDIQSNDAPLPDNFAPVSFKKRSKKGKRGSIASQQDRNETEQQQSRVLPKDSSSSHESRTIDPIDAEEGDGVSKRKTDVPYPIEDDNVNRGASQEGADAFNERTHHHELGEGHLPRSDQHRMPGAFSDDDEEPPYKLDETENDPSSNAPSQDTREVSFKDDEYTRTPFWTSASKRKSAKQQSKRAADLTKVNDTPVEPKALENPPIERREPSYDESRPVDMQSAKKSRKKVKFMNDEPDQDLEAQQTQPADANESTVASEAKDEDFELPRSSKKKSKKQKTKMQDFTEPDGPQAIVNFLLEDSSNAVADFTPNAAEPESDSREAELPVKVSESRPSREDPQPDEWGTMSSKKAKKGKKQKARMNAFQWDDNEDVQEKPTSTPSVDVDQTAEDYGQTAAFEGQAKTDAATHGHDEKAIDDFDPFSKLSKKDRKKAEKRRKQAGFTFESDPHETSSRDVSENIEEDEAAASTYSRPSENGTKQKKNYQTPDSDTGMDLRDPANKTSEGVEERSTGRPDSPVPSTAQNLAREKAVSAADVTSDPSAKFIDFTDPHPADSEPFASRDMSATDDTIDDTTDHQIDDRSLAAVEEAQDVEKHEQTFLVSDPVKSVDNEEQLESYMIPLPDSRPGSPYAAGDHRSENGMYSPQDSTSTRVTSSTSVPLRFRRPPQSPGSIKQSPLQSPSTPISQLADTPTRSRQPRPPSTEFKSSNEFRPLYLVERNRRISAPEESLPSLPSSRTTSRSPSVRDSDDGYESAFESPQISQSRDMNPLELTIDPLSANEQAVYLDSGQTTPKAGTQSPPARPQFGGDQRSPVRPAEAQDVNTINAFQHNDSVVDEPLSKKDIAVPVVASTALGAASLSRHSLSGSDDQPPSVFDKIHSWTYAEPKGRVEPRPQTSSDDMDAPTIHAEDNSQAVTGAGDRSAGGHHEEQDQQWGFPSVLTNVPEQGNDHHDSPSISTRTLDAHEASLAALEGQHTEILKEPSTVRTTAEKKKEKKSGKQKAGKSNTGKASKGKVTGPLHIFERQVDEETSLGDKGAPDELNDLVQADQHPGSTEAVNKASSWNVGNAADEDPRDAPQDFPKIEPAQRLATPERASQALMADDPAFPTTDTLDDMANDSRYNKDAGFAVPAPISEYSDTRPDERADGGTLTATKDDELSTAIAAGLEEAGFDPSLASNSAPKEAKTPDADEEFARDILLFSKKDRKAQKQRKKQAQKGLSSHETVTWDTYSSSQKETSEDTQDAKNAESVEILPETLASSQRESWSDTVDLGTKEELDGLAEAGDLLADQQLDAPSLYLDTRDHGDELTRPEREADHVVGSLRQSSPEPVSKPAFETRAARESAFDSSIMAGLVSAGFASAALANKGSDKSQHSPSPRDDSFDPMELQKPATPRADSPSQAWNSAGSPLGDTGHSKTFARRESTDPWGDDAWAPVAGSKKKKDKRKAPKTDDVKSLTEDPVAQPVSDDPFHRADSTQASEQYIDVDPPLSRSKPRDSVPGAWGNYDEDVLRVSSQTQAIHATQADYDEKAHQDATQKQAIQATHAEHNEDADQDESQMQAIPLIQAEYDEDAKQVSSQTQTIPAVQAVFEEDAHIDQSQIQPIPATQAQDEEDAPQDESQMQATQATQAEDRAELGLSSAIKIAKSEPADPGEEAPPVSREGADRPSSPAPVEEELSYSKSGKKNKKKAQKTKKTQPSIAFTESPVQERTGETPIPEPLLPAPAEEEWSNNKSDKQSKKSQKAKNAPQLFESIESPVQEAPIADPPLPALVEAEWSFNKSDKKSKKKAQKINNAQQFTESIESPVQETTAETPVVEPPLPALIEEELSYNKSDKKSKKKAKTAKNAQQFIESEPAALLVQEAVIDTPNAEPLFPEQEWSVKKSDKKSKQKAQKAMIAQHLIESPIQEATVDTPVQERAVDPLLQEGLVQAPHIEPGLNADLLDQGPRSEDNGVPVISSPQEDADWPAFTPSTKKKKGKKGKASMIDAAVQERTVESPEQSEMLQTTDAQPLVDSAMQEQGLPSEENAFPEIPAPTEDAELSSFTSFTTKKKGKKGKRSKIDAAVQEGIVGPPEQPKVLQNSDVQPLVDAAMGKQRLRSEENAFPEIPAPTEDAELSSFTSFTTKKKGKKGKASKMDPAPVTRSPVSGETQIIPGESTRMYDDPSAVENNGEQADAGSSSWPKISGPSSDADGSHSAPNIASRDTQEDDQEIMISPAATEPDKPTSGNAELTGTTNVSSPEISLEGGEPEAVESFTKNRASYLFQSPPSADDKADNLDIAEQGLSTNTMEPLEQGQAPRFDDDDAVEAEGQEYMHDRMVPGRYATANEPDPDMEVSQPRDSRPEPMDPRSASISPTTKPQDNMEDQIQSSRHSPMDLKMGYRTSSLVGAEEPIDQRRMGPSEIAREWHDEELAPEDSISMLSSNGMRRKAKRRSSSPSTSDVAANTRRAYIRSPGSNGRIVETEATIRPLSAQSNGSRAVSRASNASGSATLRRTDRSISSDLRAVNKRDGRESNLESGKMLLSRSGLASPNGSQLQPSSERAAPANYEPLKGTGNSRRQDMSDNGILEAYGDARGSPRSPTRPASIRKRQSMHILDLESRLDQLLAENQSLHEATARAQESLDDSGPSSLQSRDVKLREKDAEIHSVKTSLEMLQCEVVRLTEHNSQLQSANDNLSDDVDERYATLEAERAHAHEQWQSTAGDLAELSGRHAQLSTEMEGIVRQEISTALEDKTTEIQILRAQLDDATDRIASLQRQISATTQNDDFLNTRDEDYFDSACQQLCQHVQQWVLRFSKFSDGKSCRALAQINDEKIEARLDNSILDGTDVDQYLADRIKRRDVFMSVVMTMVWEFVFTRYLFGMDREQRQKLKSLEKTLSEVGPARAVSQWRATTLSLLSRREAFFEQRSQDTDAVVQEIYSTLERLLPPPSHFAKQVRDSLRNIMTLAVDLSIEMRTQRPEYIMLPPLQPEYDANGDLARKVYFNAALMNERSGETPSNETLDEQSAVVRVVLFPLVVKRGNEQGETNEEVVVCPAQVLIARPDKDKKGRAISGMSVSNRSMQSIAARSTMDVSDMV